MARGLKHGAVLFAILLAATVTGVIGAATANAQPYVEQPTCAVNASVVAAGGSLTVSGGDWTPGGTVNVTLQSQTYFLGSTTAGADGNFLLNVTIPSSVPPGTHTIRFSEPGAAPQTCTASITVTAVTAAGTSAAPVSAAPPAPGTGGGGNLAFTGVAVMGIGALGVVLLAGGGVLLLLGRRRGKASA